MPEILFTITVGENLDPADDPEPVIILEQRGLVTLGDPESLQTPSTEAEVERLVEGLWRSIQAHLDFGGGYDNLKQQLELAKKHAEEIN